MTSFKGKKLLILGGISPMIEVVNRAHELGITVYVTDYLEDSPAKRYADKAFMVSTTDIDEVVKLCKKEKINGIFTGCVDLLLPYYAQICNKVQLPCYGSFEHFLIMTDKKRFKEVCIEFDVPTISDFTEKKVVLSDFPLIVKPIDSSGSRGISVCYNESELDECIKKALSFSPSKQYIIEKYMTGDEVVLYYYFQDGNPVFIGMCDRYVYKDQGNHAQLPTAYIFPSRYIDNHLKETDYKIKKMFKSIHMQNGPIFLQAFIEKGVPCLYEPGYRTNGAREQYIIRETSGLDSIDMLINFALTGRMSSENIEKKSNPKMEGKCACKLSPLLKQGKVKSILGIEEIETIPEVVKVIKNNDIGDEVTEIEMGTLKQVAYRAFIVADTWERLKRVIDIIQKSVQYLDTYSNSMILAGFDTELISSHYQK